ncbi:hypothetical protein EJB05_02610, partial [Eragrostis curvula]
MAEERSPVSFLPGDIVVEILARLPARSLCACTCVSRSWHRLITDPANRHRLAQTLSGFFFAGPRFFAGVCSPTHPLVDPSFSFLPSSYKEIKLLDSCNGLFLFRCSLTPRPDLGPRLSPLFYVVCNPTTEEWVALPQPSYAPGMVFYSDEATSDTETTSAALGFDPAVSSHFHVFQLLEQEVMCTLFLDAIEIYSSETGKWVLSKTQLDKWIHSTGSMTYFNGFLHFTIDYDSVASVDTTGQTWKITTIVADREDPASSDSFDDALAIYALEDDGKEWVLKQTVSKLDLFGPDNSQDGWDLDVAGFHPDGDLIIFCDHPRLRLLSYDMNHMLVHVICTLEEVPYNHRPFNPYVPLYSRALLATAQKNDNAHEQWIFYYSTKKHEDR